MSPAASTAITGFGLVLDGSGQFCKHQFYSPHPFSHSLAEEEAQLTSLARSAEVSGKVFAANYASPTPGQLSTAVGDMLTAYNTARDRPTDFTNTGAGELGGLTLQPGVYTFTTGVTIANNLILQGGCNDVFIFQVP